MKIEIDIPDDELRTCASCSSGEMNLTLSVNETIDGYDITDIVSDVYAGNASLNFRKVEKEPCDDCISRQAVLEYIEGSGAELGHSSENELVCQDIKEFPPVTPFRKINKTYKVFCIGGDPTKIAFLAGALREKIDDLQDSGWEIDGVDLINNTRAWDSGKQMYVETPEYIIRAKKENE